MERQGKQINKFVSSSGYCSRREADKLIEQGRVMINDKVAKPTQWVQEQDSVSVDFEYIKTAKQKSIYIALHKPKGITSTTDLSDRTNIISFVNYPKRIFPIGRLDKDSEGLILLTNDGDMVNKILRAGNKHDKEYIVSVNHAITPAFISAMSSGVDILGTRTLPCKVKQLSGKKFSIILQQGLNRQIRRMCEVLGYEVQTLTRVRIMHIRLDTLAVGKWRHLHEHEVKELEKAVSQSKKEKS